MIRVIRLTSKHFQVIVYKIEGKFVNLHRHGGKQLSTPDLGRCASTSKSANFNIHEAQRQPFLWAVSLCVFVRFAERRGSMVDSPLFMPSPP